MCEHIKQQGQKVVGIGNKAQTSTHLQASCDDFHFIENIEEGFPRLEQMRLQEYLDSLLMYAFHSNPGDNEGWVTLSSLGTKLRELDQNFENRFGSRKLSEWLQSLSYHYQLDASGQKVRRIDLNRLLMYAFASIPRDNEGWVTLLSLDMKLCELDQNFQNRLRNITLSEYLELSRYYYQLDVNGQKVRPIDTEMREREALLREAYNQARRPNGLADIGQIGNVLRKIDPRFERHFGKKKLSGWLSDYPHIFKRQENDVSLLEE